MTIKRLMLERKLAYLRIARDRINAKINRTKQRLDREIKKGAEFHDQPNQD